MNATTDTTLAGPTEAEEVEYLPEELIFEDPDARIEDLTSPVVVRTAAFLADGRTSTFLLAETIAALVASQDIHSAIVDISTEAGVITAHQLLESGIPYSIFDTVPPKWDSGDRLRLDLVLAESQGKLPFDAGNIAGIDANIVLLPAPAADAGAGIDASEGTITAVVMQQLEQSQLDCRLVLPPEAGLRRRNDGSYVRLTLVLSPTQ